MPSLFEFTNPVGDVASSDFTTLYNASGLTVPNAGGGSVTGNLNVGGNLTVQGSSLLIGPVTLQSTLCLPNYCFPSPDGTTDQVLTTDGSGNLYWADVTSLPGASYAIQADTATGGANLSLVSSTTTDSVKFASGTNVTVSRTDANTITISAADIDTTYTINASATTGGANFNLVGSDLTTDTIKFAGGTNVTVSQTDASTITISSTADDIPDGTAQGQLLVWNGTQWTANSIVTFANTANRTQIRGDTGTAGRVGSSLLVVNDTGATAYGQNDGSGILIGVDSDSQLTSTFSSINSSYDTGGNHQFRVNTSTDNFASDTATSITGGNTLVFGSAHGFSAGDRILFISDTSNGLTTSTYYYVLATGLTATQCQVSLTQGGSAVALTNGTSLTLVFNTSVRLITADQDAVVFAAQNLTLNAMNPGVAGTDATITVERGTSGTDATITWSEANDQWELNQQLYITSGNLYLNDEVIGINQDNTAADSYVYLKGSTQYLKWNNTDSQFEFSDPLFITNTSPPSLFERQTTTGAQSPEELKTATNLILRVTDAGSNATDDGGPGIKFSRTSGVSGGSTVDYGIFGSVYYGTTNTAGFYLAWSDDNFAETSPGVFPGTYVLQEWQPTYSEFLNSSLYIDYTTNGAAQVGVNTNTPAYTLDVNGDAHVDTDLTVDGDISVSGVLVNLSTPVHLGQMLSVTDDVTPTISNSATVRFDNNTYRPSFRSDQGISGRISTGLQVVNDTGAVNFGDNDGSGILISVDSDTQSTTPFASVTAAYFTSGNHQFRVNTSTDNFDTATATSITGGNTLVFSAAHGYSIGDRLLYITNTSNGLTEGTYYYVIATGFTTTQCQVSLTSGGSAVSLTNGTGLNLVFTKSVRLLTVDQDSTTLAGQNLTLNALGSGVAAVDAQITVERGSTGTDSYIKWDETNDFWNVSNDLYVDGTAIGGTALATNGNNIYFNYDDVAAADSYLTVRRGASADVSIRWNEGTQRWQDTTDGSTYYNLPNQNLDTTSDVNFSSVILDGTATHNTQTTTTTSTALTTISATTRKAQKVVINIEDTVTGEIHILEALAVRKGVAAAYLTTYAEMYSNTALATFTADAVTISGSDYIRIRATPASSNSTTFTVARVSLD